MFDETVISTERAAGAIGVLTAWAKAQWQGFRLWLSYRPERRYMRGPSAA